MWPPPSINALWDQLAEFSVADGDAALTHLLSALRTMLSARSVLWGVVVRLPSPKRADPLLGWRPRLVRVLDPIPAVAASVQKQYDTLWSDDVDLSQVLSMSGDEPFRVRLLFEALPPEWFEGKHYRRHYLDVGFADSISVRIARNDDVRIRLFVFRDAQAPRFTAQDGQRLGFVMRALRWFHREQLLSHGLLIANAPLTPAERRVLLALLDGARKAGSRRSSTKVRTPRISTSNRSTPSSACTIARRSLRSGSASCDNELKPQLTWG
jgi:hypothetical protein